jgi:hypothetical protein
MGCCRQLKKWTQGDRGSWKKLAAAQRDDPLCYSCTAQGTQSLGTRQGQCCTRNPERTCLGRQAQPECNNSIRNRPKEQQHLGSKRTSGSILRKALVLEIMKWRVKPFVRILKMNVNTLWRCQPSLKWNETAYRVRAGDVGAPATLGSLPHQLKEGLLLFASCCVSWWEKESWC